MTSSRNQEDMKLARGQSSVDTEKLHIFLWGEREWQARQRIESILAKDPVFDRSRRPFLTRTELYHRALAMTNRLHELQEQHKWSAEDANLAFRILDEPLPIQLHMAAFEPVIRSQGGPTLNAQYGALIAHRGILGCYLQTELGHGTNVAALETTATYLPATREFELHSPTLTASKWWIGALGRTATHGVVQARLILPSGADAGPHLFFVQLRSLEDHRTLPGITIGDIGPKAMGGYAAVDNGFARFDRVRIPKEQMLSAFAGVTDEGGYVKPPHAKLSYGGMLYIRSSMVSSGGWTIAKAATIAIRYATVRRQGNKGKDGLERQVITYPSVYHRLLPILAHAYVFIALGRNLTASFAALLARLSAGDTALLPEMHATTAGLKVLVSSTAIGDLETARRALGGHGFSAFAGVGRLYADYVPAATYEGDNFVLDQQVVRAALKAHDALTRGAGALTPSAAYLRLLVAQDAEAQAEAEAEAEAKGGWGTRERARHARDPDASMDQRVSRAVTDAFVAVQVSEIVRGLEGDVGEKDAAVLRKLYTLHLLTAVESGLVDILSFGLLGEAGPGGDPSRSLRVAIKGLCEELLPEAIGLSDGFGFSDWELDSALGVYDGNVYETLYKAAQSEPLNKSEISAGYELHIRPMLERGQRLAGAKL
ncbi:peroxisomal oxidase [Dichomitus squalens LYAD-421 SS1]|uniref:Acyl-coenzyme A oxidase n=1 Tax=Dichomitus squalens (strain LYAD-421) TaxID=732165 RepID=R7SYW3_DICSQ|nr:peroxisomal oxidase [Dichomitus squalens LYAD-421 SS1]EJF61379.1 peroxisomal oxidase [Dichomitus squalens LYAD-421 SS1]